jgi:GTP diphosphokinase / guanosine-3',5'-bis(diphosphate) 3'-diphosphatase
VDTTKLILHAASFAAHRHRDGRRKGSDAQPYINHPLDVANMLCDIGGIDDAEILAAAILHDTVEDTETTEPEIRERFGDRIAELVLEVTDDKSLPKAERKRLQIEHAPHLSPGAKAIKLADKISNITDVTNHPPADWDTESRREYIEWGAAVVAGLRGVNEPLEKHFDETILRARATLGSPAD